MTLDQSQVTHTGFEGNLNIINIITTIKKKLYFYTVYAINVNKNNLRKSSVSHIQYTGGNKKSKIGKNIYKKVNKHNVREI